MKMMKAKIGRGMSVQKTDDGHWLCFETSGKRAMINVENSVKSKMAKDTILAWFEHVLRDWVITRDYVSAGKNDEIAMPELTMPFRLYNDDCVLCFEGMIRPDKAKMDNGPLETIGKQYGCTAMSIYNEGEWQVL